MIKLRNTFIASLMFFMATDVAIAAGIPPGDINGTYTISKSDIPLEIGVPVVLVSLNDTCHYFGGTQVSGEGKISLRIEKKMCEGHEKNLNGISVPIAKPLDRGHTLWIPVDGFIHTALDAALQGTTSALVDSFIISNCLVQVDANNRNYIANADECKTRLDELLSEIEGVPGATPEIITIQRFKASHGIL